MKIINWINNSGWKKVFTTCLVLGAFFHLLAVFFSEGFHRPDEHLGIMRFIACKLGIFSTEELGKLSWEYPARKRSSNYTYYVPLTEDMKGATIDAVVLGLKNGSDNFKPEVWICAYPAPFSERMLTLTEE